MNSRRIITVSPSSFGFLHDECPRCFYNEVHGLKKRPRTPFPSIFTAIDGAMKRHFEDDATHTLPGLEPFVMATGSRWVRSSPIAIADTDIALQIRGSYDSLLVHRADRRTLCDFKTAPVKDNLIEKYSRQLHGYVFSLEYPQSGPGLPIHALGLAVFEPTRFTVHGPTADLDGRFVWVTIERNDEAFATFIQRAGQLLAAERAPSADPQCGFCAYGRREAA